MSKRGSLRFTEAQWAEQCAKATRWTTDQRRNAGSPTREDGAPDQDSQPAPAPSNPALPKLVDLAQQKARKYGNVKTGEYASKREAERARKLDLLQAAGQIQNLRRQVQYVLIPKQDGERACSYIADFVYDEPAGTVTRYWSPVVEDCKGYRTEVYRIKRKLMLMVHGIRIRET